MLRYVPPALENTIKERNGRALPFECPMKTVNPFAAGFMDGLRIDSSVFMFIGMIVLVFDAARRNSDCAWTDGHLSMGCLLTVS